MPKVIFNYHKLDSAIKFRKSKKDNDYHIEVIFAQIGSGKSTDIAKRCYQELYEKHRYKHVFTNIATEIPGVNQFDPNDFNSGKYYFPECSLILVDEVSLLYDNRSYKSFPKTVSQYLRLCRHYKNTFIFYSQHYDCDKVIRTLASKLWLMRRYGNFSIKRRISKVISVVTSADKGNADSQIVDALQFDSIFGGVAITYIPFWTSLFNSFEKTVSDKSIIPATQPSPPQSKEL